jgi:hypothetical protein
MNEGTEGARAGDGKGRVDPRSGPQLESPGRAPRGQAERMEGARI